MAITNPSPHNEFVRKKNLSLLQLFNNEKKIEEKK
jgi:hypothetical protein